MQELTITACPTCQSPNIEKIAGPWSGSYEGGSYEVKNLEYFACPDCGEKVYPPEAMRRIQACSPAYSRRSEGTHARMAPSPAARAGA